MTTAISTVAAVEGATTEAPVAAVVEVELSDPRSRVDATSAKVLIVAKLHGHAVGTALVERAVAADPGRWRAVIDDRHGADIARHLRADGLAVAAGQLPPQSSPATPCQRRWADAVRSGPRVTIGVATRDRTDSLARCLDSLLESDYPRAQIVVVDSAPADNATASLVAERYRDRVTYLLEPRPGLAIAHNRILEIANTPIVAFTDDDVVVDEHWVTALVAAFQQHPEARAVTGLIVADELDTAVQLLLERHGSFGKGFERRVFDLVANRPDDRLFPFTAGQLGSGANMAFAVETLREVGGFDAALGAGTRARGGDDLASLFRVVARGHAVVYEPPAMVRHRHRRTADGLDLQAFGYGVGLGAYLTAVVAAHPGLALQALRHLPAATRFAFSRSSQRNQDRYDGWPQGAARRERTGLFLGPVAYLASSAAVRRGTARQRRCTRLVGRRAR